MWRFIWSDNKCGRKCSNLYYRLEAWIEVEKENDQLLLYRDLMVVYPYVALLLDYIDALCIDRDLGYLNMNEAWYAKKKSCLCDQEM